MSNYRKEELREYAEMFNALSNPNRLRIFVDHLQYCSPEDSNVSMDEARSYLQKIGEDLGLVPSTVSHHLKELRQAGLIQMERRGKHVSCWVEQDVVKKLNKFFDLNKLK